MDESPAVEGNGGYPDGWAEIHQAAGMLVAQLHVGISEAIDRLLEHAATADRTVEDVAHDIVGRRLHLSPSGRRPRSLAGCRMPTVRALGNSGRADSPATPDH